MRKPVKVESNYPYDMLGFYIPEGFARVTRKGRTDIYLIQNREPLSSYRLSLAYEFDDFEVSYKFDQMLLFLRETDVIEHLGEMQPYFKNLPDWKVWVLRLVERDVGALPCVRACEALPLLKRDPTPEEIVTATREAIATYYTRRLMREAGVSDMQRAQIY